MDNRFIGLIIGLVVGVLMIGSLLVPTITDATATEKTFTNDGYFRMTHYGTDTDVTLTWSAEDPKTMVVNDVAVPIGYDVVNGQVTIVADTTFIGRLNTTSTGVSFSFIGTGGGTHTATDSATYTFSNGTATIINVVDGQSTTYTSSYSDIYVPSLDGEFIMKKYDESAYVNEDSEIFAYGLTRIKNSSGTIPSPGAGFEFSGSIADGIEGRIWRGVDNVTVDNEQINYTANNKYIDLYQFDSITATATYHETSGEEEITTDTTVTYNYLLVPYQVTAELAQHFNTSEIAIIAVIPILFVVSLVIFAVRFINRD